MHRCIVCITTILLSIWLLPSMPRAGEAVDAGTLLNPFTPGNVAISLTEPSFVEGAVAGPEGVVKKDPVVTNTGSCGVMVFLAVTIPKGDFQDVSSGAALQVEGEEIFSFEVNPPWEAMGEGEDLGEKVRYLYFYPLALESGEATPPLFTSLKTACYKEGTLSGTVKVELEAYAIQKEAALGDAQEIYALYLAHSQEEDP